MAPGGVAPPARAGAAASLPAGDAALSYVAVGAAPPATARSVRKSSRTAWRVVCTSTSVVRASSSVARASCARAVCARWSASSRWTDAHVPNDAGTGVAVPPFAGFADGVARATSGAASWSAWTCCSRSGSPEARDTSACSRLFRRSRRMRSSASRLATAVASRSRAWRCDRGPARARAWARASSRSSSRMAASRSARRCARLAVRARSSSEPVGACTTSAARARADSNARWSTRATICSSSCTGTPTDASRTACTVTRACRAHASTRFNPSSTSSALGAAGVESRARAVVAASDSDSARITIQERRSRIRRLWCKDDAAEPRLPRRGRDVQIGACPSP